MHPRTLYKSAKVGLFIPCYVNQFYPEVAIATLQLLEKLSLNVSFPCNQTCCGQPMANSGFEKYTEGCNKLFLDLFEEFDFIVIPSGSCALHFKQHLQVNGREQQSRQIREKVYELQEFLLDVIEVEKLHSQFPFKVGLHQSCHGQRGLQLSQMSENVGREFNKGEELLRMVDGLELITLSRKDECCGFGGTFSVVEAAVSVKMGKDRIKDHIDHGADYITSGDMSCLMHMEGLLRRNRSKTKVIHIAQILNGIEK